MGRVADGNALTVTEAEGVTVLHHRNPALLAIPNPDHECRSSDTTAGPAQRETNGSLTGGGGIRDGLPSASRNGNSPAR